MPGSHLKFFPQDADEGLEVYNAELLAEWAYWLDTEQSLIGDAIEHRVTDALLSDCRTLDVVMGGPGTGKTTILLWLLKRLSAVEQHGGQLDVRFLAPASVLNQLHNATGWDLASISTLEDPVPDLVLVDDPASLSEITTLLERCESSCIVAGFDPLQMGMAISDDELKAWANSACAQTSWLSVCFRQKEVVGRAAKQVADTVAASSPFLADHKKEKHATDRLEITARCNNITFANPTGAVQTIEDPDLGDWESYFQRLYHLRQSGRLWNYWPSLLVISDPNVAVPPHWLSRLDAVTTHRGSTSDLQAIKGLEYQHVLMLLSRPTFNALERGFEGIGRGGYDKFRLFRIPFSRAKDSLTTFVFPAIDSIAKAS